MDSGESDGAGGTQATAWKRYGQQTAAVAMVAAAATPTQQGVGVLGRGNIDLQEMGLAPTPSPGSTVERGVAVHVSNPAVGPALQQRRDHGVLPSSDSDVQRSLVLRSLGLVSERWGVSPAAVA